MDPPLKRNIYPIDDWRIFLKQGKKEFNTLYQQPPYKNYKRNDFCFISILGKGSYGKVYLAVFRKTGEKYAIKMMEKYKVVKYKQVKNILQEKRILQAINFPFCVYLEMSFQSTLNIYMCLPYLSGGDMFTLLRRKKTLGEEISKFYGAQVLLALEYLHFLGIVHRDIKPENIVLDSIGYIKLTDFGFCKVIHSQRTYTFCGTPEYAAPEVILHKGYGRSVDWWSFGVLLYEMSAGYSPFAAKNHVIVCEKVISGKYKVPRFFPPELTHIIRNLLQVDLSKRFGNLKQGINDIKYHSWFDVMDWEALLNYSVPSPFVPPDRELRDHRPSKDLGSDLRLKGLQDDKYAKEFADF